MNPQPPTSLELLEEDGCESVDRELDDSWRHGNCVAEVFHRKADDTYWVACYNVSGDGEQHGLRDDEASISRVYPHTVTVVKTEFRSAP